MQLRQGPEGGRGSRDSRTFTNVIRNVRISLFPPCLPEKRGGHADWALLWKKVNQFWLRCWYLNVSIAWNYRMICQRFVYILPKSPLREKVFQLKFNTLTKSPENIAVTVLNSFRREAPPDAWLPDGTYRKKEMQRSHAKVRTFFRYCSVCHRLRNQSEPLLMMAVLREWKVKGIALAVVNNDRSQFLGPVPAQGPPLRNMTLKKKKLFVDYFTEYYIYFGSRRKGV